MELLKLILKNALRHKLRSILTVAGIAIAVLAFGLIRTVIAMWYLGIEASSPNRLIVRNAISLVSPLPIAYRNAILAVPGVSEVTYAHWFAGIYIDEQHSQFPQIAVDAPSWFRVAPEYLLPEAQMTAFMRERTAAVVGAQLAQRLGWKIGDRIRMEGRLYPGEWDFVIRGIYRGAQRSTDETLFLFHWQYIEEQLRKTEPWRAGHVGWYAVRIDDPDQAGIIARTIDARFENSLAETHTESEQAFVMGFISMSEAILIALRIVSFVIVGVILAVLSNTMAMTARERLSEYAVFKTLGFGGRHLVLLITGESMVLAMTGGLIGVFLINPAVRAFGDVMAGQIGAFFPIVAASAWTITACLLMSAAVGLAASLFPSWRASTVGIAEGLRKIG